MGLSEKGFMFTPALGIMLFVITLFAITSMLVLSNQQSAANLTIVQKTRMQELASNLNADVEQSIILATREAFYNYVSNSSCVNPIIEAGPNNSDLFAPSSSVSFKEKEKIMTEYILGSGAGNVAGQIMQNTQARFLGSVSANENINYAQGNYLLTYNPAQMNALSAAANEITQGNLVTNCISVNSCESDGIIRIIKCDNQSCQEGYFIMDLKFSQISEPVRNSLPTITISTEDAGVAMDIIPRTDRQVIVPLRLYKSLWYANESFESMGDNADIFFGGAADESNSWMGKIEDEKGLRLGICDSGCSAVAEKTDSNSPDCAHATGTNARTACKDTVYLDSFPWQIGNNTLYPQGKKYDPTNPQKDFEPLLQTAICTATDLSGTVGDDFSLVNGTNGPYDFDMCNEEHLYALDPSLYTLSYSAHAGTGIFTDDQSGEWDTRLVCYENDSAVGAKCQTSKPKEYLNCARATEINACIGLNDQKQGFTTGLSDGVDFFYRIYLKPENSNDYLETLETVESEINNLVCETELDATSANVNRCKTQTTSEGDNAICITGLSTSGTNNCCESASTKGACA